MGFFDSVLSIATGGVSDLVQGETPFSAPIESVFGEDSPTSKWLRNVSSQIYTGGFDQLPKAYQKAKTKDGFWNQTATFLDRAADPADTINYSLGKSGEYIPDNVHRVVETVGTPIASYLYGPGGAAAFAGIAGKLQGRDDLTNWQNAGIAALSSYLTGGANGGAAGAGDITTQGLLSAGAKGAVNLGKSLLLQALIQKRNPTAEYATNFFTDGGYKLGGLLQENQGLNNNLSAPSLNATPSFTKTELPKLADYDESKDKKIAEALTDEYKNYKLNDYMLYKQDPEKLQDLILRYT